MSNDLYFWTREKADASAEVDFDLIMSILAYNLYRFLAMDLERYENLPVQLLYDKFVLNCADIIIKEIFGN